MAAPTQTLEGSRMVEGELLGDVAARGSAAARRPPGIGRQGRGEDRSHSEGSYETENRRASGQVADLSRQSSS